MTGAPTAVETSCTRGVKPASTAVRRLAGAAAFNESVTVPSQPAGGDTNESCEPAGRLPLVPLVTATKLPVPGMTTGPVSRTWVTPSGAVSSKPAETVTPARPVIGARPPVAGVG